MIRLSRRTLGLILTGGLLLAGCENANQPKPVSNTTPVSKGDDHGHDHHDHAHEHGPNGGHIIELGEYHGEVAMAPTREISIYILGGDAKTAAPVEGATVKLVVKAEEKDVTLEAKSTPKDGETAEKSSRYVIAADAVPAKVEDIEDVVGKVELTVGGKTTTGAIEHHHDHDHEHEKKAEPAK
ncbi:hypothetical protein [Planctomyces sp. SH-PL14]|uniref:hypothetical protein n=1 Tax=Planctomyces sp. SH-PL14 TaxID=1632864 RepID=UPI00078D572D|nr:hypothetical protein [Planctomyces sp. SH-PL14]AMV16268.1 hypothetical protein VT03_00155 [Planctomyces sp. SH-PL14]